MTDRYKMKLSSNKLIAVILFVVFFCYAICAALIFQKLLLPMMPSVHAPGSVLTTDSAYFDSVAVSVANNVKLHGWSSWQLFPNDYSAGNVAILGALYAIFGHEPSLAIPMNAIFHAFGGVLLFLLVIEFSANSLAGRYAGIIAATLFILFPSSLNWYGQIHKDGFAIAGILGLLLVWVKALKLRQRTLPWIWLILSNLAAIVLIATVRPYYLKLLFLIVTGVLLVMLIQRLIFKKPTTWLFFLVTFVALIPAQAIVVGMGGSKALGGEAYSDTDLSIFPGWKWQESSWIPKALDSKIETVARTRIGLINYGKKVSAGSITDLSIFPGWKWQESSWIPKALDSKIETVARTRIGLINYGKKVSAGSIIDEDFAPESAGEIIAYFPRAFQVALLSPFPTSWLDKLSITRLVGIAETSIVYVCLFGLIFLWRYQRTPAVFFATYFATTFLVIYGVTIANLGTLYRVRYGFEFIFVALGLLGWLTFLEKQGKLGKWLREISLRQSVVESEAVLDKKNLPDRQDVVGAGVMVMIFTFLGFLGFFVRDILMAHTFGLGAVLDDFFMAFMIPMFIVNVFCTPLGTAFVPFFTNFQQTKSIEDGRATVSHVSAVTFGALFLVCLLLYFASPHLLAQFHLKALGGLSADLSHLMSVALLILGFSGVVILGNATLNATQRLVLPSVAQIVVPITAILALFLFGKRYGAMSVMLGMVVGQLLNLLIVEFYLDKSGISLLPRYRPQLASTISPLWQQYLPLLASAFFAGVALPIDTMLAATLSEGSVSAFNLGTKVVLFISGLLGATVSSVMLPYFSTLVEKNGLHLAKKELSLFLLITTFVSVPASAFLYVWSEPVVRFLFERGTFGGNDVVLVSRIMQYALIQIPFFVCNILLLKYATATRHSFTITLTALAGLVVNIGVSLVLMPRMGVAGIALAASLSMLISSAMLVIALVRFGHIRSLDAVVVILNWMLFLTLLISIHFKSPSSVVMVLMTYMALLFGYFKLMVQGETSLA